MDIQHNSVRIRCNNIWLELRKLFPCLFLLQMVANMSGCETMESEALVHCLKGKSEAEILALNKVHVLEGLFLFFKFCVQYEQQDRLL